MTSEEFALERHDAKPRGRPFAKGNGKRKLGSRTKPRFSASPGKPRVYLPQRIADRSSFST